MAVGTMKMAMTRIFITLRIFMKFKEFFNRSISIIIDPGREFEAIRMQDPSPVAVNKNYTTLVSAIVSLFALVGLVFSNINSPMNVFLYVLINVIIVYLLVFTHIYLSGKLIAWIGRNADPGSRHSHLYALSAYSQIPFFIILSFIKLFPSLIFLIFIGLYSAYLFFTGTGIMTSVNREKRIQFTILSSLLMIITFVICSELYSLLYNEIIVEFSTFAVR